MTATVSTPLDYVDYQVQSSPPWMQGPLGTSWSEALALLKDAYAAAIRLAVKCRFPEWAPSDALDAIGRTLGIDRALAPNDQAFIGQMMNGWATWEEAGTEPGMVAVLTQAGLANVAVWEAWYWSDGNPAWYFTVTASLLMPWNSFPLADGTWGDGNPSKIWTDGGIWASGIPVPFRQRLKAILTKWKPTHAVCAAVIVDLGTGQIWGVGGHTWGDGGTWSGGATLYINMTV